MRDHDVGVAFSGAFGGPAGLSANLIINRLKRGGATPDRALENIVSNYIIKYCQNNFGQLSAPIQQHTRNTIPST